MDEMTTTEQLDFLTNELREARAELNEIKETLIRSEAVISKVAGEVMPTLDSLMKSPMLKMLLPKDKRL